MSEALDVWKNRTNVVTVSLGIDVSDDTITSEIRTASGTLIVTWTVTFDGDGTDGELILTLDDGALTAVGYTSGLMDLKRVTGGQPVVVFENPIEVIFKDPVTT